MFDIEATAQVSFPSHLSAMVSNFSLDIDRAEYANVVIIRMNSPAIERIRNAGS